MKRTPYCKECGSDNIVMDWNGGRANSGGSPLLWPFKVLVFMLYDRSGIVDKVGDESLISTNKLSSRLGITNYRLKEYLDRLKMLGYIEDVKYFHGVARLKIVRLSNAR